MKIILKFCLTSIYLFLSVGVFSQNFIDEIKQWAIVSQMFESTDYFTSTYQFSGDSVLNGKTYHKLYESVDLDQENRSLNSLWYENNDSVYKYNYLSSQDDLIYDFNIDVGDTFVVDDFLSLKVDSITDKNWGGSLRKHWYLSRLDGYSPTTTVWIKGIGQTGYFVRSTEIDIVGAVVELLCFHENGNLIYQNPKYNNCYVLNKDTTYCINNPLQELKWLTELVEVIKDNPVKIEIYKCIYNYQEGFLIDRCVGCPDGLVEFYDCDGNVICEFGGFDGRNTCPDFESSVSNMELIWTNNDSTTVANNIKGNPEIQCYLNHGSLVLKFRDTDNPQYNLSIATLDGKIIHSGNYNTWNLRLDNLGLKPKRLYLVSIQNSKQKMVYKLFNY